MKIADFLKLLERSDQTHYAVLAPDHLGLTMLVPKTLRKIASADDVHVFNAENLTKDKVRASEEPSL